MKWLQEMRERSEARSKDAKRRAMEAEEFKLRVYARMAEIYVNGVEAGKHQPSFLGLFGLERKDHADIQVALIAREAYQRGMENGARLTAKG